MKDSDDILESEKRVELQTLLDKYKAYLKQNNHENYAAYTVQQLRTRIESHYKNNVSITDESHKRQSIYNIKISIADAINTASAYKHILHDQSFEQKNRGRSGSSFAYICNRIHFSTESVEMPIMPHFGFESRFIPSSRDISVETHLNSDFC